MSTVTDVIDQQVDAYLSRDLDGFLAHYAADIAITDFAGNVLMDLEGMRAQYGVLFRQSPNLSARIVNRIVIGDVVIDEEEIHNAGPP